MCAHYWNLTATFTCPACTKVNRKANLQTHYGDGYCTFYARLGQPADWLDGVTVTLGPPPAPDDFIGFCERCDVIVDFGAQIEKGTVVRVWPYAYEQDGRRVEVAA